jgi:decaprenyl-phosphate phosphoribosyltransferase
METSGQSPEQPAKGHPNGFHPGHSRALAPLIALRPKQWIKNLLVFVAPAAAGTLTDKVVRNNTILAFLAFCLVSSAVYLFNDLRDLESDRAHPKKRNRPLAAGTLSPTLGIVELIIAGVGGLVLSLLLPSPHLFIILVIYLVINLAYGFRLKREPVIEMACVASGFVLRAVAGGAASNTRLSVWFIVVVSFGALFIVAGKRLAEMPSAGVLGEKRAVLSRYTKSFLEAVITISLTAMIVGYCLWAFTDTGLAGRALGREVYIQLSIVPVILGALWSLRLLDRGEGGTPENLAYHDRFLQICAIAWVALIAVGVYA